MSFNANSFFGANGARRRLAFRDIGSNINSQDFELYSDGIIDLDWLASVATQDFELYSDGLSPAFVRDLSKRGYVDFETSELFSFSGLSPIAISGGATLAPSGKIIDRYCGVYEIYESISDGLISGLPLPLTTLGAPAQPTGAFFKFYA